MSPPVLTRCGEFKRVQTQRNATRSRRGNWPLQSIVKQVFDYSYSPEVACRMLRKWVDAEFLIFYSTAPKGGGIEYQELGINRQ